MGKVPSRTDEQLTEFVSRVLEIDYTPRDIAGVSREPRKAITKLRQAYKAGRPVGPPPRRGSRHTRPYASSLFSGEVRGAPDAFAVELRAELARQLLVYHHEVCIDDPVQAFLNSPLAEQFYNRDGVQRLLTELGSLAPLVEAGLVHVVQSEDATLSPREEKVARKIAKATWRTPTEPSNEVAIVLLEGLKLRSLCGGSVDLYLPWGQPLLPTLEAFQESPTFKGWRTKPPKAVQSMVVVPDVHGLNASDVLALRNYGVIEDWLASLGSAVEVFEATYDGSDGAKDLAAAEFRDHLASARDRLVRELKMSAIAKRGALSGRRSVGIGAAGFLGYFADWKAAMLTLSGQALVESVIASRTAWKERKRKQPMLSHYDTFLPSG